MNRAQERRGLLIESRELLKRIKGYKKTGDANGLLICFIRYGILKRGYRLTWPQG